MDGAANHWQYCWLSKTFLPVRVWRDYDSLIFNLIFNLTFPLTYGNTPALSINNKHTDVASPFLLCSARITTCTLCGSSSLLRLFPLNHLTLFVGQGYQAHVTLYLLCLPLSIFGSSLTPWVRCNAHDCQLVPPLSTAFCCLSFAWSSFQLNR